MSEAIGRLRKRLLRSTALLVLGFLAMLAFPPVTSLGEWGGASHGYAPFWVLAMPKPFSGPLLQIEMSRFLGQVLVLLLVHATFVAYALFVAWADVKAGSP